MDELLIKYLLGEATPAEAAQVGRWLEADAANRERYEQYKTLWALGRRTAVGAGPEAANTVKAWRQLQSTLGQPGRTGEVPVGGNRNRTGWLRLAAVMIGILLLGAGGYFLLMTPRPVAPPEPVAGTVQPGSPEVPSAVRSLPVPENERVSDRERKFWRREKLLAGSRPKTDTLPDGTLVTLNRGASLTLTGGSVEKGLTVRLQGEGFFSVKHDPTRAFVVQLGTVAIKVLGTSFELNGNGKDSIELVVETGAVRVGDSLIVHAGEQLSMTGRNAWKIGPNQDKLYGYYLGRPLVCNSIPLRQLLEVVNRTGDTPILLGRKELGALPLTTVFRWETPERILDVVALTFNLSIVRQGSAIILQ